MIYDMAIIGGGPAGLTAALYALRNGKKIAIIEKSVFGGAIVNSPKVENIPGFVSISGDEFGDLMLKQVMNLGGDVIFDKAIKISNDGNTVRVFLELGDIIEAKTLIIATGTKHRTLGLANEEKLIGNKIHFCAVCDGNFYKDKTVIMIGGGNSAFVEANLLSNIVKKLIILQDLPTFTAEAKLQEELLSKNNVEAHTGTKILEYVLEDDKFVGVKYLENGEEKYAYADGVFLAVGLIPDNGIYKEYAELDSNGYFDSSENTKTKTANIFVAGDCRKKTLRQVVTAASDGAIAAMAAIDYLRTNNK